MAQATQVQLDLFRRIDFMHVGKGLDTLVDNLNTHVTKADNMIRFAAFSTKEIFDLFVPSADASDTEADIPAQLCNLQFKVGLKRLRTFKNNCMCVGCGRVGNTFLVERHKNNNPDVRHLILYSVTDKDMVAMTVDHILPDSMAGRYTSTNLQTMCSKCNTKKTNHMSLSEIALVRANPTDHIKTWAYQPYIMLLLEMQEKMAYTQDKSTVSKWRHQFNEALKCLDAKKATTPYMHGRCQSLQVRIDKLNGIEVRPVAKPAPQPKKVHNPVAIPTFGQRVRAWFAEQKRAIKLFRVVTQRTA